MFEGFSRKQLEKFIKEREKDKRTITEEFARGKRTAEERDSIRKQLDSSILSAVNYMASIPTDSSVSDMGYSAIDSKSAEKYIGEKALSKLSSSKKTSNLKGIVGEVGKGLVENISSEAINPSKKTKSSDATAAKEMHESYEGDKHLTAEQLKEVKQKEKLDKEQLKEVKEEEKKLQESNAIPGVVSTGSSAATTSASQNESVEEQQEIEDEKQSISEDVNQKIEDAKAARDEKIDKIKAGPTGILGFFANGAVFILIGVIDSIFSALPVAGDIMMAVVLAIVWFIPALLLFDLFLYIRILLFLVIDAIFGATVGTFAVIGTPLLDGLVDFIPEAFVIFSSTSPAHLIRKAYFEKVPDLIAKARSQCQIKIERIRAEGRDKIKYAIKGLRGHFTGVASEGRKVLFVLLFVLTGVLSQVYGWFGIDSSSQIIFTGIYLLVLFVFKAIGLLGTREFAGIAAFLGFNILLRYIFQADSFITSLIGSGNSLIVTVIFIIISILLIIKVAKPESMSSQRMVGIVTFIILILAVPYMIGYVGSEQFTLDIERRQVEAQVEVDNFNFWERSVNWYYEMQARGRGDYIPPADQERVHEFIGVTLEGIEVTRQEFLEGKPVQFNIYYSTGSKEEQLVFTSCDVLGKQGTVFPDTPVPATELYTPVVKCVFDGLPKGTHLVNINSFYDFSSQINMPVMFMSEQQKNFILDGGGDPQTFEGGVNKPLTSSGPIDFGVSNRGDGSFTMPLVIDKENPNQFPNTINLRLDNPEGNTRTQGDIKIINKMEYNLPQGLKLTTCNFQNNSAEILEPTSKENGRWITDITNNFETVNPYEYITCNIYIDPEYINEYVPVTGYSIKTMYFDLEYTYGLTQQTPATVT